MHWYIKAFMQFANFSGRARRREFWTFILFNAFIFFALLIVDEMLQTDHPDWAVGWVSGAYLLLSALPSLAVSVRRLHDTSRPGWWVLLGALPLLNLVLIWFYLQDSSRGSNAWGPNPKPESDITEAGPQSL